MKTYSLENSATGLALESTMRLYPLVSTNRVLPAGLSTVAMGWSAVYVAFPGRSGFRACTWVPRGARGVMLMPVGRIWLCSVFWPAMHSGRIQNSDAIAVFIETGSIRYLPFTFSAHRVAGHHEFRVNSQRLIPWVRWFDAPNQPSSSP